MYSIKRIPHRGVVEFALRTQDEEHAEEVLTDAATHYARISGLKVKRLSNLYPILPGSRRGGFGLVLEIDK